MKEQDYGIWRLGRVLMSEIDEVKEEISYLKSIVSVLLAALFAVSGWFILYDGNDVKSGMALAAIVSLIGALLVFHAKITKLIRKLREL